MKTILFVDGTSGFSPERRFEKPAGGIVTSLSIIPRIIAAAGYSVYVLSGWKEERTINGVCYRNLEGGAYKAPPPDLVVYNRNTINRQMLKVWQCPSILWLHDIVDYRYFEDDAIESVDRIIALSRYCRDSYADFYDIPRDRFAIIPNGVDRAVFYPGRYEDRDPNVFIFASAPIKGFGPLDFVFYQLRRRNPKFELRVFSSQSLHDLEDSSEQRKALETLASHGANIIGPVPQAELAEQMRRAWCLLMPNTYPEICSNLLLQARACGLPVVTSPIGSATEFIDHEHTGLLSKRTPSDIYWWWKEYTIQAIRLWDEPSLHQHISNHAANGVPYWEDIAAAWLSEIRRLSSKHQEVA